jgi:predicted PurR-regulated permease PerM
VTKDVDASTLRLPFSSTLNTLLILLIVVTILFFAREVLLPVALAGILSFMLAPLVRRLQNLWVPRGLAVVSVVLLAFGAIFALGTVMARQVTHLAADLPQHQAAITDKIQRLSGSGETGTAATLKRAKEVIEDLGKEIGTSKGTPAAPRAPLPVEVHEPIGSPLQTIRNLISPLLSPIATTGLIIVFVIFILIQREDIRNRLIRLVGATDIPHTTAAIDDAAHRLSHLFLTQLAINTGFAILIGLGLWWIGVPNPFGAYLREFCVSFPTLGRSLAWSSRWHLLCQLILAGPWCFGPWPYFSFSKP